MYLGERPQSFCSSPCKHSDCLDNGPGSDIPQQRSLKTQTCCFISCPTLTVLRAHSEDMFSKNHGHAEVVMQKSTSGHEAHTAGIHIQLESAPLAL